MRINLINFTIRVPDTSDTNAIWTMRVRYECYTNVTIATRATQARHTWGMSAAQTTRLRHKRKILVLITTGVKTYFHNPIVAIWQMKDYKERNNSFWELSFGNVLFLCQNVFEKCTLKNELCNGKIYIKKLHTTMQMKITLHSSTA